MCTCCCATCGSAILGPVAYEKYVNQHSKHVFGSHMHEMVHKHKPGGTHSITEMMIIIMIIMITIIIIITIMIMILGLIINSLCLAARSNNHN